MQIAPFLLFFSRIVDFLFSQKKLCAQTYLSALVSLFVKKQHLLSETWFLGEIVMAAAKRSKIKKDDFASRNFLFWYFNFFSFNMYNLMCFCFCVGFVWFSQCLFCVNRRKLLLYVGVCCLCVGVFSYHLIANSKNTFNNCVCDPFNPFRFTGGLVLSRDFLHLGLYSWFIYSGEGKRKITVTYVKTLIHSVSGFS